MTTVPDRESEDTNSRNLIDIETELQRRPVVTYTLVAITTVAAMIVLLGASTAADIDRYLLSLAVMPSQLAHGQLWRLITGPWLHESWSHLAVNVVALLFAGRLVESIYASVRTWCIFAASALGGTFGTIISGVTVSVGASGAVFGFIGALFVAGYRLRSQLTPRSVRLVLVIPAFVLVSSPLLHLFNWEQSDAMVDLGAHICGAITGMLVGSLMLRQVVLERALVSEVAPKRAGRLKAEQWLGLLLVATHLVGLVCALPYANTSVPVRAAKVRTIEVDSVTLSVPVDYNRGVWRSGRCEGTMVPVQWALETARTSCFRLPLGGWLLLGRRSQLLTMDKGDEEAMRHAKREQRFVRRQQRVMLYPAGRQWLYVVVSTEALHASYNEALADLLRRAAPATIGVRQQRQPAFKKPPSGT